MTMAKPSPPIQCHFECLIGSPLQIVAAELLEDLAVHWYLRRGGLKLTTTYFILILLTVDSWQSCPPRFDKAINFDGLIGSRLQIVDAESLEDLVVHYYLRWGGLKLIRTYFVLVLPTVVISDGVEKHSPVRCHFDGLIVSRLQIAAAGRCANDLVF